MKLIEAVEIHVSNIWSFPHYLEWIWFAQFKPKHQILNNPRRMFSCFYFSQKTFVMNVRQSQDKGLEWNPGAHIEVKVKTLKCEFVFAIFFPKVMLSSFLKLCMSVLPAVQLLEIIQL